MNTRLKHLLRTLCIAIAFAGFIMILILVNERNCKKNFEAEFGIALASARENQADATEKIKPRIHEAVANFRAAMIAREELVKAARYTFDDVQVADRKIADTRGRFDHLVRLANCACRFPDMPAAYPEDTGASPKK
jgi:hypothetical protein